MMAYTISDLYVMQDNKCLIPLETILNDEIKAFVNTIDATTPLATVFGNASDGMTVYKVNTSDTTIYPVVVPVGTQNSDGAIVTLFKTGGAGMFTFEYDGDLYINHAYNGRGGVTALGWYKVTTTAVN